MSPCKRCGEIVFICQIRDPPPPSGIDQPKIGWRWHRACLTRPMRRPAREQGKFARLTWMSTWQRERDTRSDTDVLFRQASLAVFPQSGQNNRKCNKTVLALVLSSQRCENMHVWSVVHICIFQGSWSCLHQSWYPERTFDDLLISNMTFVLNYKCLPYGLKIYCP